MRSLLPTCLTALLVAAACGQNTPAEPAPAKTVKPSDTASNKTGEAKVSKTEPDKASTPPAKSAEPRPKPPKVAAAPDEPTKKPAASAAPAMVPESDAHLARKDLPATYSDDSADAWLDVVLTTGGVLHVDGLLVAKDALTKLGSDAVGKGIAQALKHLPATREATLEVPRGTGLRAAAQLLAALPRESIRDVELVGSRRIDGTHSDSVLSMTLSQQPAAPVTYRPEAETTLDCKAVGAIGRTAAKDAVQYAVTIDGERVVARRTDATGKPTGDKPKVDLKAAKATGRLLRFADRAKRDATVRLYLDEGLNWEAAIQYVSAIRYACTDTAETAARLEAKRNWPTRPKKVVGPRKIGLEAMLSSKSFGAGGILGSFGGDVRVKCGMTRRRAMRLEVHVCRKQGAAAAVATVNPFKHAAPPKKRRQTLGDPLAGKLSGAMIGGASALKIGSGSGGLGFAGTGSGGGGGGGGAAIGGFGTKALGSGGKGGGGFLNDRKIAKLRFDSISATGSCDKAAVRRNVRRRAAGLRYCYERSLVVDPSVAGGVTAGFTITATGSVEGTKLSGSLKDGKVRRCLERAFKGMRFSRPESGTCSVTATMSFSASK